MNKQTKANLVGLITLAAPAVAGSWTGIVTSYIVRNAPIGVKLMMLPAVLVVGGALGAAAAEAWGNVAEVLIPEHNDVVEEEIGS